MAIALLRYQVYQTQGVRITEEIDFARTDLKLFQQWTLKNKKGINTSKATEQ